tara:strand:+ start:404 stop:607 length:204 start_codon:yes stop_codon:yes gene_type:complete
MDINKIINIIRELKEEGGIANVTGAAALGFNPETETPPVYLNKKKKRPPIIARGLMPGARKRWSKKA